MGPTSSSERVNLGVTTPKDWEPPASQATGQRRIQNPIQFDPIKERSNQIGCVEGRIVGALDDAAQSVQDAAATGGHAVDLQREETARRRRRRRRRRLQVEADPQVRRLRQDVRRKRRAAAAETTQFRRRRPAAVQNLRPLKKKEINPDGKFAEKIRKMKKNELHVNT